MYKRYKKLTDLIISKELPWWLRGKESACNAGDPVLIPGLGRCPGEENGNPLQTSCLENPMDRGAWWATVDGVAKVGYNWAHLWGVSLDSFLENTCKLLIYAMLSQTQIHWIQTRRENSVFPSVQFSCSIMSNSLRPHGLQHARPPCPSPTPGLYPNSCRSSRWCHPTISSSVVPFSSCLQSFPASGSFPMSQFFASGGQRTGVSASASVLPMNTRDWSPLGWTGWISAVQGLSRVFSNTTVQKHQFFSTQVSLWSNSHIHIWPLEKP